MSIEFTVPGIPISQPRQRHALIAGHLRNYTPSKHPVNDYKAAVKIMASNNFITPYHGPVIVAITAYFPRPKSHYRHAKGLCALKKDAPLAHTTKPDAENVAKAILDALTGVAYLDDKQVYILHVTKYYGDNPRTIIFIKEKDTECPTSTT